MTDILKALMENFRSDIFTPEQLALRKEMAEFIEPVEEKMSRKESDAFWSAIGTLEAYDREEYFTLGYRLGVQLVVAGLAAAEAAPL